VLVNLISPSDYSVMAWKNGKGKTTELMSGKDAGDESFLWRLSIASVSEDGCFSDFSGYNRVLIMLAGNGMSLIHDNDRRDILDKKFDFCRFSGDKKTVSKLKNGPIKDFNIICQNGKYISGTPIFISGSSEFKISCAAEHTFIYSSDKSGVYWTNSDSQRKEIPFNHLLHARLTLGQEISVVGEGLICVQIKKVRSGSAPY
jgi:environmental stress-induced protein Ves